MLTLFRGEKTYLFWAGLIILCFACVFLFAVLWSGYQSLPSVPSYVFLSLLPAIVGAIVFVVIGLFMMNPGAGEKPSLFWAGLIILSLASLILFQEAWGTYWYYSYYINWWSMLNIPVIVGSIVFILLGFFMMKSGFKREVASAQS